MFRNEFYHSCTGLTQKLDYFLPRASELYWRMLSQGANQSYINKQILKGFSKISQPPKKNMAKIIMNSFKNSTIIYLQNNHGQIGLLDYKICDQKCSYHQ